VFFAFCYPYSYEDIQAQLSRYDTALAFPWSTPHPPPSAAAAPGDPSCDGGAHVVAAAMAPTTAAAVDGDGAAIENAKPRADAQADTNVAEPNLVQPPSIYYHRELLVRSIDGLRVDLLTVRVQCSQSVLDHSWRYSISLPSLSLVGEQIRPKTWNPDKVSRPLSLHPSCVRYPHPHR
jgi:hypothetical protein